MPTIQSPKILKAINQRMTKLPKEPQWPNKPGFAKKRKQKTKKSLSYARKSRSSREHKSIFKLTSRKRDRNSRKWRR